MPGGIRQMNASYDAMQDRILLSIATDDGTEFRFWVTRRYLLLLWSLLCRMATAFANARAGGDPIRREALAELAHHQAHQGADFAARYEAGTRFPLGEDPILLVKVTLRQPQAGPATVTLLPYEGSGVDLGLDERMTHLLASLLQRTVVQAEWQATLAPLAPPAMGEAAAPRSLH